MDLFGLRRGSLFRKAKRGVAKLLSGTIKEIMTDYVVTISPEKSVVDAASKMIGEDVSALVVEKDEKPIGILTERDFIQKVPVTQKVFSLPVKKIMSGSFEGKGKLETVKATTTIQEARDLMRSHHIRKLIVVKDDGFIAGIITQSDLSKVLYDRLSVVARIDAPFLVKDVMSKKVVSVESNRSFSEAKKVMAANKVSALPIKKGKEYVGIFTEYDVVTQFFDAGGKLEIKGIEELMKSPLKAIPAELNIFDANTVMLFQKVRRLLVVEDGKVVGVVSQTDLVHACFAYAELLQKNLDSKAPLSAFILLKKSSEIVSAYGGEHVRIYTFKN